MPPSVANATRRPKRFHVAVELIELVMRQEVGRPKTPACAGEPHQIVSKLARRRPSSSKIRKRAYAAAA
jgi:hypothetical protein